MNLFRVKCPTGRITTKSLRQRMNKMSPFLSAPLLGLLVLTGVNRVAAARSKPARKRHFGKRSIHHWVTLVPALSAALIGPAALHAQTAGSLDRAFNPDVTGSFVFGTAVQPDGKIVLTGSFTGVGGQPSSKLARLNADGTVESTTTFNPGTGTGVYTAKSAAVQADGKIIVVGQFPTVDGQPRNKIVRLLSNGSVESLATFNPGTGANLQPYSVAIQADGKILIAGQFTSVDGQPRNGIARLNADGTVESTATFNPGTGAESIGILGAQANVYSVAVQADGKILVGGDFITVNGQPRNGIARLNADGTVEDTATFNPGTGVSGGGGVGSYVASVALQADGKILIGGNFTSVNGLPRNYVARLNADGTVESTATFNPGTGAGTVVNSMTLQADGKILIGGNFTSVNGLPRNHVARLLPNGTVESTAAFNPGTGADFFIYSMALQADGKILIGGSFASVDGQPRNRLARLANDASTQTLALPDNTRVRWLRNGATPEVEQVTFEVSTDGGANWTLLGSGARISGGWELSGLSLTGSGFIRARGRTVGGNGDGSSGLVESVSAFPAAPLLSVAQSNGFAIISWPSPSTGFALQQNTNLNTTNWVTPSETITDNGTNKFIIVNPLTNRFYRLRRP